jgi:putative polyketide hydroxylase
MKLEQFPVVIVGAGAAGLSSTLLLLQQGIRPLLVERREKVSWYPRARNLNFRSLEVFRSLGLSEKIQQAGAHVSRVFTRKYLASFEQKELLDPSADLDARNLSPEPNWWYCPQSRLEPLLLATARELGCDVRYATDLIEVTQNNDRVTALLHDHATGKSYVVATQYLIGADGAHSHVRQELDIPVQGKGTLDEHYVFVYVRCDLDKLVRGYESDAFIIENPDVRCIFVLAEKNLGMFVLTEGKSAQKVSIDKAQELIKHAIGKSDVEAEVIELAQWQTEQRVAERFQQGHVFLVGDAAHTMPPKEGLGANTAIQSAQNLVWKLAAVMQKRAGPELLSTYFTERHPVAWFAAKHSMTGPAAAVLDQTPMEKKVSEFFPVVGYRYRSPAIISEHELTSPSDQIDLLEREDLTGEPGTRVPHIWLERKSQRISTLDLFDGRFVLLTGSENDFWFEKVIQIAKSMDVPLVTYRIGSNYELRDPLNEWAGRMGVSSNGAILIRPDAFVAWRTIDIATFSATSFAGVLNRILCHSITAANIG